MTLALETKKAKIQIKRMNRYLSKKVQSLKPSGIRKFFDLVLSAGEEVISLGVGEPDFSTPWHIREAAIFSLEKGFTSYTENAGLLELRQSIALRLKKETDQHYDPKTEILVTNGVSEGMDLAFRATINPGDKILIPDPGFVCYESLIRLTDGITIPYHPLKIFSKDPAHSEETLASIAQKNPDIKGLVLNFPGNPLGNVFSEGIQLSIQKLAEKNDWLVYSDEIYDNLSFSQKHQSFLNMKNTKERTIYFNGLSKSTSMTGFRIGWACGPSNIIQAMNHIHAYSAMCSNSTAQIAAVEALRRGDTEREKMKTAFNERRKYCTQRLEKISIPFYPPQGAFYFFLDIRSTNLSDKDFCERCLAEEKLAVVPGSAFGENGRGFVRITYAESQEILEKALDRLERFWKKVTPQ
jgi:aminotransferase